MNSLTLLKQINIFWAKNCDQHIYTIDEIEPLVHLVLEYVNQLVDGSFLILQIISKSWSVDHCKHRT
jgi:hypothetical protein